MAEQIPEAWQGQEVTLYYGPQGEQRTGTLESVAERGIVLRANPGTESENVSWYPITSVIRLMQGTPRGAEAISF
jgi:hypothetical protein